MKEKYSICVVGVYFGTLPKYFNLWLKSCEYNKDVDFLIVGDNNLENLPSNVKNINISLSQMKEMAQDKLGMQISLERPYKCCDFKVVYGVIFEDYLKEYDFWGHCDFDLVFGDLRKFITDDILTKCDKILSLGHLSLYRNSPEVNSRYKLKGSNCGDYKEVFSSDESFAFDEICGIYSIYKKNNLPMYDARVFADIASVYTRFRLALDDKNYKHQTFYWENGKTIRAFYKDKKIHTEEFVYIHFKKRGFDKTLKDSQARYYITPNGFIAKETEGKPSLEEIQSSNPYSVKQEFSDNFKRIINFVKARFKGLKRRLKKALKK